MKGMPQLIYATFLRLTLLAIVVAAQFALATDTTWAQSTLQIE